MFIAITDAAFSIGGCTSNFEKEGQSVKLVGATDAESQGSLLCLGLLQADGYEQSDAIVNIININEQPPTLDPGDPVKTIEKPENVSNPRAYLFACKKTNGAL